MVTQYGMNEVLGMVKLGETSTDPFAQRANGSDAPGSDDTQHLVDIEVRKLIDQAHADAYDALNQNRDILDRLAYELLEKETLDQAQLTEIFSTVRKAPKRRVWLIDEDRPGSDRPPIEVPERIVPENPEVWEAPLPGTGDADEAAAGEVGAGSQGAPASGAPAHGTPAGGAVTPEPPNTQPPGPNQPGGQPQPPQPQFPPTAPQPPVTGPGTPGGGNPGVGGAGPENPGPENPGWGPTPPRKGPRH